MAAGNFLPVMNQKIMQELTILLSHLSSEQNELRKAAEDQLNNHWLKQPEALLQGLSFLCLSNDESCKTYALVILRKVALRVSGEHALIAHLSDQGLQVVQQNLLTALQNEPNISARLKTCDTVCEIADYLLGINSIGFLYRIVVVVG